MEEKLVSMITPSYNYGHYISDLLDSVLSQTYNNIEMFVVDDGSTDNTKDVVESYIEKFADVGKKLVYIYQDNAGQPGAINAGLRNISGEYLVWPDADDWYCTDTAIADLVDIFENSPENVGVVRGLQYLRDEKSFEIVGTHGIEDRIYPKKLFAQCLLADTRNGDWWYTSGNYMIKTKHLFHYYPNKEIYWRGFWGQNIQLLFPSLYDYDCVTLNQYTYNVRQNAASDSRRKRPIAELIRRYNGLKNMCIATLNVIPNMPDKEKKRLRRAVRLSFFRHCFSALCLGPTKTCVKKVLIFLNLWRAQK